MSDFGIKVVLVSTLILNDKRQEALYLFLTHKIMDNRVWSGFVARDCQLRSGILAFANGLAKLNQPHPRTPFCN